MKKIFSKSLAMAVVLAAGFSFAAEAAVFGTDVKTEQGVVTGVCDEQHKVVEWLGVPLADAERWQAPKAL